MASFKDKVKNTTTIGNRKLNSDEALGLSFQNSSKVLSSVKISALTTNPYQPRLDMNKIELEELANSIDEVGLLQPIVIAPIENNPKKFYIVAGHRRVEAHKLLNKQILDAIIYNLSDVELRVFALVENLQRSNLSSIEEALAIRDLASLGIKQVEICKKISKSTSAVSQLIKIANMNNDVIKHLKENNEKISLSILYEISNIEPVQQLDALLYVKEHALDRDSVRDYVKSLLNKKVQKVQPAKHFNGFSISKNKSKISFKLDIAKVEDKTEVIEELENILKELKNV